MRLYRALQPVTLMACALVLMSEAQARIRAHALEPTDDPNVWRATAPIQFKAGETFGCTDKLPAILAELVDNESENGAASPPASPPPPSATTTGEGEGEGEGVGSQPLPPGDSAAPQDLPAAPAGTAADDVMPALQLDPPVVEDTAAAADPVAPKHARKR